MLQINIARAAGPTKEPVASQVVDESVNGEERGSRVGIFCVYVCEGVYSVYAVVHRDPSVGRPEQMSSSLLVTKA